MQNPFLIGERIYLRPLEREDAAVFQPWVNDREVTRTLMHYRPMTLQDENAFLDRMQSDPNAFTFGIVLRKDDRLIGNTGLFAVRLTDRHAGFGLLIGDKREWNRGYGTEATSLVVGYAFETLNLNRVWLQVYEHNAGGRRAYEKVGFREEGLLRQHQYRDGRYWNVIMMGILRRDWEAAKEPGRRGAAARPMDRRTAGRTGGPTPPQPTAAPTTARPTAARRTSARGTGRTRRPSR